VHRLRPHLASQSNVQIIHELANSLEVLVNVVYLLRFDRGDPDRVLTLVEMADDQLRSQIELFYALQAQTPN